VSPRELAWPCTNELPGMAPVAVILARTEETVVAVTGIRAYPTRFGFTLNLRLRNLDPRQRLGFWPSERGLDGGGSAGSSLFGQRDDELVGGSGAVRAARLEHAGGGRAQLGRRVGQLGERAVVSAAEVMPRQHRARALCHHAARRGQ
jgi:hypothetical protein